ncbi:MAG: hypothetical protein EHM19_09790, partial [Candidatus Latescibacterota bacterium]
MERKLRLLSLLVLLSLPLAPARAEKLSYPAAQKGDVVDDYHGLNVADPYRRLEDLDSKETADWIAA